jgi:hypothetical protein
MQPLRARLAGLAARAAVGALIVVPLAGLAAQPAAATIDGAGCTAQASDSSGKAVPSSISINATGVWNVSKDSHLSGSGTAPSDQTMGYADVMAFGFGFIPIAGGSGHGTSGSGSLDVAAYSKYVRVFPGYGYSDSCSGSLIVVVQDESVLDTLAGKLAAALTAFGLVGLVAVVVRRGS